MVFLRHRSIIFVLYTDIIDFRDIFRTQINTLVENYENVNLLLYKIYVMILNLEKYKISHLYLDKTLELLCESYINYS